MSEENDGPAGLPRTVTYEPLPSIYRAFAAGATPYAIITETIDNSIDFVRRQALNEEYAPSTLEVDIRFEPSDKIDIEEYEDRVPRNFEDDEEGEIEPVPGRLIITDNGGGVPPEDLAKFFQLGHSDAPPEGIGRFGVGAKRLIGIGNHIKYESHAHGYDIAAGFEVDAAKLENSGNASTESAYQSDVYEVPDLEENKTRIIIEDLKRGVWERLCGANDGIIDRGAENSLWRLEETYEHFLRDDIKVDPTEEQTKESIELNLTWGVKGVDDTDISPNSESVLQVDQQVSTPERVELSYLPFDGLFPRVYEGMPFANDDDTPLEECLRVDIEVGLLPRSNPEKAGLTVTMNNRNVLFRDTNNELFSSRYLGKFRPSAGHGRLYCIVSIHGEASDMPWSDTKDTLDGTQEVTDEILNVTENALREYRRQTYDNLPDWILEVYSINRLKDRDYFNIEGIPHHPEYIDKSNSKTNSPRFNQKPGENKPGSSYRQFPTRDRLVRTARLHDALRIRCDDAVEEILRPAYTNYFERVYDKPGPTAVETSNLPNIDDYIVPLQSDSEETIPLIEDIRELIARHSSDGVRLTTETEGVAQWILPRYIEELRQKLNNSEVEQLRSLEEFNLQKWRRKFSTSEEVRVESDTDHPLDVSERESIAPAETPASDSDETHLQSADRAISDSRPTIEAPPQDSPEESEESRNLVAENTPTQATFSNASTTTPSPSSPTLYYNGGSHELTDEEVCGLLEALDLDDEAEPEKIISSLLTALMEREEMEEQLRELAEYVNIEGLLGRPPVIEDKE